MAKSGSIALVADPDDPVDFDVSESGVARALAEREVRHGRAKGGRPAGSNKQQVSLRIDVTVLARWRAGAPGWQSRINEALRKTVP